MQSNHFIGLGAIVLLAAVAGCGGGGSSRGDSPIPIGSPTPATTPTAGASPAGTAPASLVAIVPKPGLPTVPPASATLPPAPVGDPSPVVGTPIASPLPVPAPSGADLAALVNGGTVSTAYYQSLAAPVTSRFVMPESALKGVYGSIVSFLPDGFVIGVRPVMDVGAQLQAGSPFASDVDAVGAATVSAHVTSASADIVPGGYGSLHMGDLVLVIGNGPPSNFSAGLVMGKPGSGATLASLSAERVTPDVAAYVPPSLETPFDGTRPDASNNVRAYTSFALTRTFGYPGFTFPDPPRTLPSNPFVCASVSIQAFTSVGAGETANYPMQLQDISSPSEFVEGKDQALPALVVNAPNEKGQPFTYKVSYGVSASAAFVINLKGCHLAPAIPDGEYMISVGSVGQQLLAQSAFELPGNGATEMIPHVSCPFFPLKLDPSLLVSFLLNLGTSPSFSTCLDFKLVGTPLKASAQITNAKLISANEMTSDTTWEWLSNLPDGDPNVRFVPYASPKNGATQKNTMKLGTFIYNGDFFVMPHLLASLPYSPSFNVLGNGIQIAFPSIFQEPGLPFAGNYGPIYGISKPDPVVIMLKPGDGNTGISGK